MWEKEEDDRVGEHGKEISFKKVGIKLKSKREPMENTACLLETRRKRIRGLNAHLLLHFKLVFLLLCCGGADVSTGNGVDGA